MSDDEEVLQAVAEHSLTPLDVLQYFLESNNPALIITSLANENMTAKMMTDVMIRFEKYAYQEPADTRGISLSFDVFKQMAKSARSSDVLENLFFLVLSMTERKYALDTIPNELLESLNIIASNPHTECWILEELARYDLSKVKAAAAANRHTPLSSLQDLYEEGYWHGLLLNDSFPFEQKMTLEFLNAIVDDNLLERFFLRYDKLLTREVSKLVYEDISSHVAKAMLTSSTVRSLLTDEEVSLLILQFGLTQAKL